MCFLRLFALIAACCLALATPLAAEVRATDITGREVTLPAPAQRIVLAEARHLTALGMLHDDPVALVVGWRENKALDPATFEAYRARFPAIDAIRSVGSGNRDLSVESIIALMPDLVVMPLADARDETLAHARRQIEAAGIPIAFVDFFSHPQENTLPSLAILGTLTGAEARAAEFAAFYTERLDRITTRLNDAALARPDVFIHAHAVASDCCATVGEGIFNDFVALAGGQNIGAAIVPGVVGKVSLEYLISQDPAFYVASGGQHLAGRGGLVLGAGVDAAQAEASFAALTGAPGLRALSAVREGRAVGLWHMFNDSPSHIALIEYLAQTFHPELFADLDPAGTLAEINTRFAPVELTGIWWIGGPADD